MELPLCTEAIYSNAYFNYLISTDNELLDAGRSVFFDCKTMVDERYGVGYRLLQAGETYNIDETYYESIPKCYGLMENTAVEDTGAARLYTLPGINVSGKDVLIGYIDTGIDYRNPLFSNASGTRIEAIWDQTEEVYGTSPAVFGYGAEYTREQIDEALLSDDPFAIVPSRDDIGHGTFLASVASGGVDAAENFRGMAFESGILVVKLKQAKKNLRDFFFVAEDAPCYSEDDIILAVRYLLNKAALLNKPLVICFGIGSSQGNHTGSTALESYLEQFVNVRGLCVVSSVGNELGYSGHYAGNITRLMEGGTDNIEIGVGDNCKGFSMELWGKAPGLLRTAILSPTGERFSGIPFLGDRSVEIRFLYEGTRVYVSNVGIDDINGDQIILFRFERPTEGIWTIEVEGYGRQLITGFDAWLPINEFLDAEVRFVRGEPEVTICSPGNSRGVISVAGYDHINKSLYFRSGRGYTRDGKIKPDITAPAVSVKGAFATSGSGSLFTKRTGTSVASAVTAGAAALIMDWVRSQGIYPGVSTEIIRQLLIRGVKYVNDVTYPNERWGYGVLDLLSTFEKLRT